MLYPSEIQAAVLFDRPVNSLLEVVKAFVDGDAERTGTTYNMLEHKPSAYFLMFGTNDLMISFEYIDGRCDPAALNASLSSAITRIVTPDVEERIARHRSHVLVNVQRGAMGGREIQAMLAKTGLDLPGSNYPAFRRQLTYAALITQLVQAIDGALLIHWTQSDQLLAPSIFNVFAEAGTPGPLHVHPYLFGPQPDPGEDRQVGLRTFGVRHFLSREVVIEPNPLPWNDNYEAMFVFMRMALIENGYVIPDGDTFGNESRTISYRVSYCDAEEGDVPFYCLDPLLNTGHGFRSPDYVSPERRIDQDRPPASVMPARPADRAELMGEWRQKRTLAEGIGGSFEVKAKGDAPIPPPPPLGQNRMGRVFGRRGL